LSFFEELKRRHVFKVGIAYVIVAWLILQVSDVVLGQIGMPDWVFKFTLYLLVICFPLILMFAWAYDMTPDGLRKTDDVDTAANSAGESEPAKAPSRASVAVLPFVNMSDNPENEYFSDGLSEELLNVLSKVSSLKVAARTSSFYFKGHTGDIADIARQLGVASVLEGSVRQSGEHIRITAQLIKAEDGYHLWSESYDREVDDVFAIQDEISAAILVQLKAHLIGVDTETLASSERTNSEVYELYLLARQQLYARTTPAIQFAAEQLDKAIAIDPDYAPALALRGISTLLLSEWSYGDIHHLEAESRAKVFLDKSLELDPKLAEAWAGKGLYHGNRPGEDAEEIAALQKALSINPNLMDASNWLQIVYGEVGENRLSLEILEQMVDRDPLYRPAFTNTVMGYNLFGMQEKSWALIERLRPFIPGDESILFSEANTWLSMGRPSKAIPIYDRILTDQPNVAPSRFRLSLSLIQTGQFERLSKEGLAGFRVVGLTALKRNEEANLMAEKMSATGDIIPMLIFLSRTGQNERLVNLFRLRWPDLNAFETDFPSDGEGHWLMLNMAQAFSKTGNGEKARDALARVRIAHDRSIKQGIVSAFLIFQEARYYAHMGNQEEAINQLQQAAEIPAMIAGPLAEFWPVFESLRGHPRFESTQARLIETMNQERASLGLVPLEI